VVNRLLSRIDVHFSSVADCQLSWYWLSVASADVNGSLFMDGNVRAFAFINSIVADIVT